MISAFTKLKRQWGNSFMFKRKQKKNADLITREREKKDT